MVKETLDTFELNNRMEQTSQNFQTALNNGIRISAPPTNAFADVLSFNSTSITLRNASLLEHFGLCSS